ncbi:Uncharacterised protein [Vibrio cholerae]|nr:Uncharacterised protein [Vibrio cholerae]CSI67991.1 Uncharacterised protein [Vibrio cholerae]CSI82642.1 Uncharacterised protein [Vibrio cholerae]
MVRLVERLHFAVRGNVFDFVGQTIFIDESELAILLFKLQVDTR